MTILWEEQSLTPVVPKTSKITAEISVVNLEGTWFSVDFKIEVDGVAKTFLRQVVIVEPLNPNKLSVKAYNLSFAGNAPNPPEDSDSVTGLQEVYTLYEFPISDFLAEVTTSSPSS